MKVEQNFTIINKTGFTLDFVNVSPDTSNYKTIAIGDSLYYKCDMTNLPKVDGNYVIHFIETEQKRLKSYKFGYYTNGSPIETEIRILIFPDSISALSIF